MEPTIAPANAANVVTNIGGGEVNRNEDSFTRGVEVNK
jgi:hypothetical protein